ncbi:MAG: beta-1,6-N-acetylglucosaminyltransferase [Oscillospiraceae bacterium]|nr:beta-1,6-N-acetylglucosaminyltransferase [Oscillospiraceae bacterium]
MKKHAYMIMAHGGFEMLRLLVSALDDDRNDIFIHMDKKAAGFEEGDISSAAHASGVFFLPRISVQWGGYSQIDCMLRLLDAASEKGDYAYLHLVSGTDMPLKSQDELHEYFDEKQGTEFIEFSAPRVDENTRCRFSLYHFFMEWKSKGPRWKRLEDKSLEIQMRLGVNRAADSRLHFMKGATWFSVTGNFARFLLAQRGELRRLYRLTNCCDEVFIQTAAYNSEFKDRLFDKSFTAEGFGNLRYTRWDEGLNSPAVLEEDDIEKAIECGCLFARKFDLESGLGALRLALKTQGREDLLPR